VGDARKHAQEGRLEQALSTYDAILGAWKEGKRYEFSRQDIEKERDVVKVKIADAHLDKAIELIGKENLAAARDEFNAARQLAGDSYARVKETEGKLAVLRQETADKYLSQAQSSIEKGDLDTAGRLVEAAKQAYGDYQRVRTVGEELAKARERALIITDLANVQREITSTSERVQKLYQEHPIFQIVGEIKDRDEKSLTIWGRAYPIGSKGALGTNFYEANLIVINPDKRCDHGSHYLEGKHCFMRKSTGTNAFGAPVHVWVYGDPPEEMMLDAKKVRDLREKEKGLNAKLDEISPLSPIPCSDCNGKGTVIGRCDKCGGTGYCPRCKGTGHYEYDAPCEVCRGTGYVRAYGYEKFSCNNPRCYNGKVRTKQPCCEVCKGSKKCRVCKGSGEVVLKGVVCRNCNGSGMVRPRR
jgi:hypothetical protein